MFIKNDAATAADDDDDAYQEMCFSNFNGRFREICCFYANNSIKLFGRIKVWFHVQ